MRIATWIALPLLLPAAAAAQAPVTDGVARDAAVVQGQQRASAAYRELERAEFEAKLAEQDYLNARDAEAAARRLAEMRERHVESTKKALAAAQARVAEARKRYEAALAGVDEAFRKKPGK